MLVLHAAALAYGPAAPPVAPPQLQTTGAQNEVGKQEAVLIPRFLYADPDGSDSHDGESLETPWKTLKHAIPQLRPGDTLFLRGGTYFESEISIDVSGAPEAPITIRAYPGERPVIDGSYAEFREVPNQAWDLVDAARQIYRSVQPYPDAGAVYGHFDERDGSWALVPYESQAPFGTVNEAYSETPPYYYVGPGVFWDATDSHIYYRSQHSFHQELDGLPVPSVSDPGQTALFLYANQEVLEIEDDTAYLVLQGLEILNQRTGLELDSGVHHVTVRNCRVRGGRYHVLVRDGCHDLVFDGLTIAGGFPDWVTWTDVKRPSFAPPAHLLQGSAINLTGHNDRVEIMNSSFTGVFDGIGASEFTTELRVHHNVFDVRDDVLHLSAASWNIEFDHNTVLRAIAGGPSWSGPGSPPASMAGRVYVHHNVIDTSVPQRYGRWDPQGLLDVDYLGPAGDGFATGRTFGMHSKDAISGPAPWKIYHNTAILAQDVSNGGAGQAYRITWYDPAVPHEVYNNIFVQVADDWVLRNARAADGSQIHDGNLYWAPDLLPGTDLFEDIWTGPLKDDFASLQAFVGSPTWQATRAYYAPGWESSGVQADPLLDEQYRPEAGGPAASGAVDLSGKDWPGLTGETFRGALPPVPSSN